MNIRLTLDQSLARNESERSKVGTPGVRSLLEPLLVRPLERPANFLASTHVLQATLGSLCYGSVTWRRRFNSELVLSEDESGKRVWVEAKRLGRQPVSLLGP